MEEHPPSVGQERLYAPDVAGRGYIWDLTRASAHQLETIEQPVALFASAADAAPLAPRDKTKGLSGFPARHKYSCSTLGAQ